MIYQLSSLEVIKWAFNNISMEEKARDSLFEYFSWPHL
jgi:hypothetical protein